MSTNILVSATPLPAVSSVELLRQYIDGLVPALGAPASTRQSSQFGSSIALIRGLAGSAATPTSLMSAAKRARASDEVDRMQKAASALARKSVLGRSSDLYATLQRVSTLNTAAFTVGSALVAGGFARVVIAKSGVIFPFFVDGIVCLQVVNRGGTLIQVGRSMVAAARLAATPAKSVFGMLNTRTSYFGAGISAVQLLVAPEQTRCSAETDLFFSFLAIAGSLSNPVSILVLVVTSAYSITSMLGANPIPNIMDQWCEASRRRMAEDARKSAGGTGGTSSQALLFMQNQNNTKPNYPSPGGNPTYAGQDGGWGP